MTKYITITEKTASKIRGLLEVLRMDFSEDDPKMYREIGNLKKKLEVE